MYEVVLSNRFRRDLKLAARRGCDLALLNDIVERLAKGEALAARHRDYFESLSDESLAELAEEATGFLVARLEGSR